MVQQGSEHGGAQHWCTPGYWGRDIGKFHIITSVIITFHPITSRTAQLGVTGGQREPGLEPALPQERERQLRQQSGASTVAAGGAWTAGDCPLQPWEGLLTHIALYRIL